MPLKTYTPQQLPAPNQRLAQWQENQRIKLSLDSIIAILKALDVPVEIGAADSAGVGYRVLRIPN